VPVDSGKLAIKNCLLEGFQPVAGRVSDENLNGLAACCTIRRQGFFYSNKVVEVTNEKRNPSEISSNRPTNFSL